jgi:hypothetical protein
MTTDTERDFTGTNFAAITVVILAVLALVLIIYSSVDDVRDNGTFDTDASSSELIYPVGDDSSAGETP